MGGDVRASKHQADPVASSLARGLVVLLAVVLLLGAADPTPRFLGLYRRAHGETVRVTTRRVNPVLPDYSPPVAISCGTTSSEEFVAAPAFVAPTTALELVLRASQPEVARRLLSLDPLRRNGAGPPLRC